MLDIIKMKVLLINPPHEYLDTTNETSKSLSLIVQPLGLAYIAAVLEKNNIKVNIFDGQVQEKFKYTELLKEVRQANPDLIGITSSTVTFHRAVEAAKEIKEYKNIPIVIGGPHANALPIEILKEQNCFDFVIFGEGEYTMLDLAKTIETNGELSNVNGLVYRKDSRIIKNAPRPHIKNLDELPFPARHLLPDITKYNYVAFKRLPSTNLITSRGCPFNCIFCDHPFGKSVRLHSSDYSVREIEHLVDTYKIKDLQFYDENLMYDKTRLHQICDKLIEKKIDITWSCSARADKADYALFKKMKTAGCWVVSFGIESGNQEVLNFIKKGTTLEMVRNAVKLAKKAGLHARGSFMIGHPIDTKETIIQTIKFVKSLKLDHASCSITVPYPGSELYDIAEKYGSFKKKDFSKFKRQDDTELSFVPFGFTEKELIRLQKKARIDIYFKSTYPFRALKSITSTEHLKKYLQGAQSILVNNILKINKKKNKDRKSQNEK